MPLLFTGEGKEPIKVACKSCIDGHRSPTCFHLDRILVQVRQPGRPRVHCNHGKPSWGLDRCKQCYPTIAYVVPGHGATHARKCGCHRDKNEPIHDWERTSEETAEQHERSRAQELEEKRANRRMSQQYGGKRGTQHAQSQPQTPAPSTCCAPAMGAATAGNSPTSLTPSAAPSAVQSPFITAGSRYGAHDAASPHGMHLTGPQCGHNATSLSYLTQDMSSLTRQAVTPWIQGQVPFQGSAQSARAECNCGDGPGQCHCVGCSRHPDNKETVDYVTQLWDTNEQQMPETPAAERQNPFMFPQNFSTSGFDFPMFNDDGQNPVASPEQMNGLENQKQLPQFEVWTAMGECPSCNCGPGCRCAQCPCHGSESGQSGQSSNSMQSSMSSDFHEPSSRTSGHELFNGPSIPDHHPSTGRSSGLGDAKMNVDYMDLSQVPPNDMITQGQHGEESMDYHRSYEVDLAHSLSTVTDSTIWNNTALAHFHQDREKEHEAEMPGVVSTGAYLNGAASYHQTYPLASDPLRKSIQTFHDNGPAQPSTAGVQSQQLASGAVGINGARSTSMPSSPKGTGLLEPSLV